MNTDIVWFRAKSSSILRQVSNHDSPDDYSGVPLRLKFTSISIFYDVYIYTIIVRVLVRFYLTTW